MTLVYFGFTYCPDICPTDLMQMALAVDQLGQAGELVQPVFITVDPERDTPEHLKEYVQPFHPRFVGLSGDAIAIQAAARAYRAYYNRSNGYDRSDYTVDHSAFIYLMGPDGEYLAPFPPAHPQSGSPGSSARISPRNANMLASSKRPVPLPEELASDHAQGLHRVRRGGKLPDACGQGDRTISRPGTNLGPTHRTDLGQPETARRRTEPMICGAALRRCWPLLASGPA